MNLDKYISEMPSKALVKIGTDLGGGFLYAGPARDWDPHLMDCTIRSALRGRAKNKKYHGNARYIENAERDLREYTPLASREIVKAYPSIIESAEIIIIRGKEIGKRFMCDERPKPAVIETEAGCTALVAEIYIGVAKDLKKADAELPKKQAEADAALAKHRAYEWHTLFDTYDPDGSAVTLLELWQAYRTKCEERDAVTDTIRKYESWFAEDPWGILSKPGIVDVIRRSEREDTDIGTL